MEILEKIAFSLLISAFATFVFYGTFFLFGPAKKVHYTQISECIYECQKHLFAVDTNGVCYCIDGREITIPVKQE